jgi:hypothetical protein
MLLNNNLIAECKIAAIKEKKQDCLLIKDYKQVFASCIYEEELNFIILKIFEKRDPKVINKHYIYVNKYKCQSLKLQVRWALILLDLLYCDLPHILLLT